MNDEIRGARPRVRSHWRTIGAALGALGILAGAVVAAEHLLARFSAIQAYTVANTTQDGCKPYQVQAASLGTFNLRVCISDNGTGTARPAPDLEHR